MLGPLTGKKVAFLVANEGVEQAELTQPWQAVEQAGGSPVLIAPAAGTVRAFKQLDKACLFPTDVAAEDARVADYAGLVLPGGVTNPDQLRTSAAAVTLVRQFVAAGKPIATICHGPWTLVEADVLGGKTLTSWPSLQTDIRNAGGDWVDRAVVVSDEQGFVLVSSRGPADLPFFCREAVRVLTAG